MNCIECGVQIHEHSPYYEEVPGGFVCTWYCKVQRSDRLAAEMMSHERVMSTIFADDEDYFRALGVPGLTVPPELELVEVT